MYLKKILYLIIFISFQNNYSSGNSPENNFDSELSTEVLTNIDGSPIWTKVENPLLEELLTSNPLFNPNLAQKLIFQMHKEALQLHSKIKRKRSNPEDID